MYAHPVATRVLTEQLKRKGVRYSCVIRPGTNMDHVARAGRGHGVLDSRIAGISATRARGIITAEVWVDKVHPTVVTARKLKRCSRERCRRRCLPLAGGSQPRDRGEAQDRSGPSERLHRSP